MPILGSSGTTTFLSNIIANYLCAIYNVSLEELAGTLEDNFNDVFNI